MYILALEGLSIGLDNRYLLSLAVSAQSLAICPEAAVPLALRADLRDSVPCGQHVIGDKLVGPGLYCRRYRSGSGRPERSRSSG